MRLLLLWETSTCKIANSSVIPIKHQNVAYFRFSQSAAFAVIPNVIS
jgi:hypothetical protein